MATVWGPALPTGLSPQLQHSNRSLNLYNHPYLVLRLKIRGTGRESTLVRFLSVSVILLLAHRLSPDVDYIVVQHSLMLLAKNCDDRKLGAESMVQTMNLMKISAFMCVDAHKKYFC